MEHPCSSIQRRVQRILPPVRRPLVTDRFDEWKCEISCSQNREEVCLFGVPSEADQQHPRNGGRREDGEMDECRPSVPPWGATVVPTAN